MVCEFMTYPTPYTVDPALDAALADLLRVDRTDGADSPRGESARDALDEYWYAACRDIQRLAARLLADIDRPYTHAWLDVLVSLHQLWEASGFPLAARALVETLAAAWDVPAVRRCERCGSPVDDETCWCGDAADTHTWSHGHDPSAMGCRCASRYT